MRCPSCTAPMFRLQRSFGVAAAYPCGCWLTPDRAAAVTAAARAAAYAEPPARRQVVSAPIRPRR